MGELDTLGRALRWLREERNLKQLDVALAAGITRPMVSAYEREKVKPTVETLERLLQAMDCTLEDLSRALHVVTAPPRRGLPELPSLLDDAATETLSPAGAAEQRAFRDLMVATHRWLELLRRASLERTAGPRG